jgi:hypothetical protein
VADSQVTDMQPKSIVALTLVLSCSFTTADAFAIGGRDHIATSATGVTGPPYTAMTSTRYGVKVTTRADRWSKEVLHLVNHPLRTDGWHPWFSGLANDYVEFDYDVLAMKDVNGLLEFLGRIDAPDVTVILKQGSDRAPVMFGIGNQSIVDHWFEDQPIHSVHRRNGRFTPPKAAPPTMILFVDHPAIDLGELDIPSNLHVVAGRDAKRDASATAIRIEEFINEHAQLQEPGGTAK